MMIERKSYTLMGAILVGVALILSYTKAVAEECQYPANVLEVIDRNLDEQVRKDPGSIRSAVELASDNNWDGALENFLHYWRGRPEALLMIRYFPHAFRVGASKVNRNAPALPNPECK